MQATSIEVTVGSCYEWFCDCGELLRVAGPLHIQPQRVDCGCGATYELVDGGEVRVAIAPPKPTPTKKVVERVVEPKPEIEAVRSEPPAGRSLRESDTESRPIRPASLGTEPAYAGKAKRGKK